MPANRAVRRCAVVSLLVAAVLPAPVLARDKTDVVRLTNGDRVTGEIVKLEYGMMTVKTDHVGTIYVEWPSVAAVESEHAFLVEQIGGRRFFGRLRPGEGGVTVSDGAGNEVVRLSEVVAIGQVEDDFWQRVKGSASIGANYAKSTSVSASSARFDATYRSRKLQSTLDGSFDRTSTPESGESDRARLAYTQAFLRPGARYWLGLASIERNEELGIDGRLQAGGAYAWRFHERRDSVASVYAGAVMNQEWVTGTAASQSNVEGVVGLAWQIFRFAKPETSLSSGLAVYPSLTDSGRIRARTDVTLKRKLGADFTFQLQFYDDYDNRPPGDRTATNDYGFSTSLGYTW